METCFNYTDKEMFVSSDERKIINKIHWIAKEYADEITIIKEPEDNDGCIYAKMPASWLKIKPPVKHSAEYMEQLRERGRQLAETRKNAIRDEPERGGMER